MLNGQYDSMMDYVVEDVFKIASREEVKGYIEKMFNDKTLDIKIEKPLSINISDVEKIGEKHYSLVQYDFTMYMKYKDVLFDNDKERKIMNDILIDNLRNKFGKQNVKLDKKSGYIQILQKVYLCAISYDGINDWKLASIGKAQKNLLMKFIPLQILERVN